MPRTPAQIEAAARALAKRWGHNPDWPIGVDKNGYAQEPYVREVPSWEWYCKADAQAALSAAEAAAQKPLATDPEALPDGALLKSTMRRRAAMAQIEAAAEALLNLFERVTPPSTCWNLVSDAKRDRCREFAKAALSAAEVAIDPVSLLSSLTDDQRVDVFSHFCRHCGSLDPRCQCWNDE